MTVPVPPDLFVGLVTHPRSRFPQARTQDGLAAQVQQEARRHGWSVASIVIDDDLLTDDMLTIDRQQVTASIDAELAVEAQWREYVANRPLSAKERAVLAARRIKRRIDLAPPWQRSLDDQSPGVRMVRRLANIELAHLSAMRAAVDSGARWALLLEDDAQTPQPGTFTQDLIAFTTAADTAGEPRTINLSESFTIEQLGIGHILTPRRNEGQPQGWNTSASAKIVTNTVCAVLYRGDYLTQLTEAIEAIPLSPVIPIDFKVNAAVMRINDSYPPGACWVASPAPVEQGSGVPQVSS